MTTIVQIQLADKINGSPVFLGVPPGYDGNEIPVHGLFPSEFAKDESYAQ